MKKVHNTDMVTNMKSYMVTIPMTLNDLYLRFISASGNLLEDNIWILEDYVGQHA